MSLVTLYDKLKYFLAIIEVKQGSTWPGNRGRHFLTEIFTVKAVPISKRLKKKDF